VATPGRFLGISVHRPVRPLYGGPDSGDAMALGRELKRRSKAAIAPLVFLAITGYFGWSATQGNHGLVAFAQRQTLLQQAEQEHADAQTERDAWERRVAGLRANHLDPDTLDERARAMLNLAAPNDVIVPYTAKDRLF
jgi:cell division protein FtsB